MQLSCRLYRGTGSLLYSTANSWTYVFVIATPQFSKGADPSTLSLKEVVANFARNNERRMAQKVSPLRHIVKQRFRFILACGLG